MALFEESGGTAGTYGEFNDTSDTRRYQTFQDTRKQTITSVALWLKREGNGHNVTVSIRATTGTNPNTEPTGSNLCVSNAVDCSAISLTGEWVTFTFTSSYDLEKNTEYAIVARGDGDASNRTPWAAMASGNYTGGNTGYSNDAEATWTAQDADDLFRAYGDEITTSSDKVYSKQLVAVGNGELWYESSAGTMVELAAANGEIETTDPLTIVEAFQKIFIANKTNLKVADFANTKIATTDLNTHAPDKVVLFMDTELPQLRSQVEKL
jgi:hypothetical protein